MLLAKGRVIEMQVMYPNIDRSLGHDFCKTLKGARRSDVHLRHAADVECPERRFLWKLRCQYVGLSTTYFFYASCASRSSAPIGREPTQFPAPESALPPL